MYWWLKEVPRQPQEVFNGETDYVDDVSVSNEVIVIVVPDAAGKFRVLSICEPHCSCHKYLFMVNIQASRTRLSFITFNNSFIAGFAGRERQVF